MVVSAKANDQVRIEQIGGAKTMPGFMWTEAVSERDQLRERLAQADVAMKAAASLPGEMWLTGQLALAEFLSGEGGEHLKYALEQYEQHEAAKGSGENNE